MANTIRLRRGSNVPTPGSFAEGEPAWDSTNKRLYVKAADGTMVEIGRVSNGDKGDITVSGNGDVWIIDNGVISSAKIASNTITNENISSSAGIAGSKLQAASTTGAGAVQLTDSTSSTSTETAATPNSVKSAYDLAAAALPKSGGTVTGDVTLSNQSDLRFGEATGNGTNYVALHAPSSITANTTFTLPSTDGTANQFLKTDGSGVLGWATAGMSLLATDTYSVGGSTPYSWSKPSGAKLVVVIAIGAGGGGASGGASANTSTGGTGGGGAGATVQRVFPADILSASETVIVGLKGFGGASRTFTAAGSNGSVVGDPGANGADSKFGPWLIAEGGSGGIVNTSSSAVGGGGVSGAQIVAGYTIPIEIGGNGADGSATDNNPLATAAAAATFSISAGGGAGGSVGATSVAVDGTAGGLAGALSAGTLGLGAGSTTASATGGNGGNGSTSASGLQGSGGGGGGNAATSWANAAARATGGNGGDGGVGAGGGGGGAARTATTTGAIATSGRGGNGGDGKVVIYTYG